jgi:menaquinone-dependent protoporphyrinogen oxidase
MKPILVVYGTVEGQTRKISEFIAETLRSLGFEVETLDSDNAGAVSFEPYGAVIAGAPVHISSFPKKFSELIARNANSLATIPSAFFSVCLGVLQRDEPETLQAERNFVSNFFITTGWQPQKWAIFPGALLYSKYGWFKKRLMRTIARKAGKTTDTKHDYEFTDWGEVRTFTQEFAESLKSR